MKFKSNPSKSNPTVALIYTRRSQTRDANDMDSPKRQLENCLAVCQANGWIPEIYEDTEGHKSGTQEKNRPGWMRLKSRLGDSDVVALIANDLSRLHRKGWRIGDLIEETEARNVKLMLAAPGRQFDFSTLGGKIMAMIIAIFDEYYAADISARSKDMIYTRKKKGIGVGNPPFGTTRDKTTGRLTPSKMGAWLMPDSSFLKGTINEPPNEDALWRGYYEATRAVLDLYVQNKWGYDAIATLMQQLGWSYGDRNKLPRDFKGEDVRRIISNWAEYGGYVYEGKARDRHPDDYDISKIILDSERSVFPIDLLYEVGRVQQERAVGHMPDYGIKTEDYQYALNGVVRCAHCERIANELNDMSHNTGLAGIWHNLGKPRYRHKQSGKCDSVNKSVKAEILEAEFVRLLNHLIVKPEHVERLLSLGLQAHQVDIVSDDSASIEAEKRASILKLRRQLEANVHLYADGEYEYQEYLRRKDRFERELAAWEARTTETEKVTIELALCVQEIERMASLWENSDDDDRNGLVRHLFQYVTYDLETQRIVDFRLKPWADRFITVRGALYEEEKGLEKTILVPQDQYTEIVPTGLDTVFVPSALIFPVWSASIVYKSYRTIRYRLAQSFN